MLQSKTRKVGFVLKKGEYPITPFDVTNAFLFTFPWVIGGVCFAYLHHLLVLFYLIYQQICDFYKSVIFEIKDTEEIADSWRHR